MRENNNGRKQTMRRRLALLVGLMVVPALLEGCVLGGLIGGAGRLVGGAAIGAGRLVGGAVRGTGRLLFGSVVGQDELSGSVSEGLPGPTTTVSPR